MSLTNYPATGPDGTIPVNDAIQLAKNWRDFLTASNQQFVGRSFFIPIIDFSNIQAFNPDAEGVRAYIGLDDPADPMTAKLILVPVVNGQDVLVVYPDASPGNLGDDGQSNTYDLTRMCPPVCPVGSPLSQ